MWVSNEALLVLRIYLGYPKSSLRLVDFVRGRPKGGASRFAIGEGDDSRPVLHLASGIHIYVTKL